MIYKARRLYAVGIRAVRCEQRLDRGEETCVRIAHAPYLLASSGNEGSVYTTAFLYTQQKWPREEGWRKHVVLPQEVDLTIFLQRNTATLFIISVCAVRVTLRENDPEPLLETRSGIIPGVLSNQYEEAYETGKATALHWFDPEDGWGEHVISIKAFPFWKVIQEAGVPVS